MSDSWSERRVSEFATRKKVVNENGEDLPPLSITKDRGVVLQSEKYKKRVATDPRKYVVVEDGDFAFDPMSLYYGALGRVEGVGRGLISPDYAAFTVDPSVDPEFLEYKLRSQEMIRIYERVAQAGNQFGKRRRVYWSVLADLAVLLPPLPEQRAIAVTLKAVDDAIAAGKAVLTQLERVRIALLDDLLRHGIPSPTARKARSATPWPVRPLAEIGALQTGLAKGKVPSGPAIEMPYLRVANVQDGFVDLSEVKTVVVDQSAVERYALRRGDVLFTEGGNLDQLGRGCVWQGQIEPCLHQNHVFAVRTGPEVLPDFLAAHAASSAGRAYFLDCAKRTTNLASINSTQLKAFPVPVPTLDEQRMIVAAVRALSERVVGERAALEQRRRVRAALADGLLSGTLRLSNAEVPEVRA